MVKIHYKKTDANQFLYETTVQISIDELIQQLIDINNARIVIDRLSVSIEDLGTYGVLKPEELRGLTTKDTIEAAVETMPQNLKKYGEKPVLQQGQRYNEDKNGYRMGVILGEDITNTMLQECSKAKEYISKNQVEKKVNLTKQGIEDCLNNLRGVMMMAYPGYHNLPEWEPARLILENKFEFENMQQDIMEVEIFFSQYLDIKTASLWWAGKELMRGKILSEYVGKNEKTKIVVRMQKSGSGAPVREPAVDEETYKKMLSYYHKKSEEQKKLEDDNDDNYLNAEWANPNQLKNALHGNNVGISWKKK